MELNTYHSINELFAQLGLPSDDKSIDEFIEQHKPLSEKITIADAPWWNKVQAEFLLQALEENAIWAYAVDQLNERVRLENPHKDSHRVYKMD